MALICGKCKNTGDIVVHCGELLLGKVAHQVHAFTIGDGHDVEEKGLHVKEQRLVVEKEFGEKTQVLAVLFLLVAVHFKVGNVALSVDLLAGRVPKRTLGRVSLKYSGGVHALEAKLANVQLQAALKVIRVRRGVPNVDLMLSKDDTLDARVTSGRGGSVFRLKFKR